MPSSTGAMRELIVIQSISRTADGGGGYTNSWATAQSIYAHVRQLSGSEPYTQGQLSSEGRWQFTARYVAGVTPTHRISWNSKIFNIREIINDDERDKYLIINAEEGVAA